MQFSCSSVPSFVVREQEFNKFCVVDIDEDASDVVVDVRDEDAVVADDSFVDNVVVIVEMFRVMFGNSVDDSLFNVEFIKFIVSSIMFLIFSSSS